MLVGCSRAGSIVLDTALEFPDRVSGIAWVCGGISGLGRDETPRRWRSCERSEALEAAKDWAAVAELDVAMWVDGFGQPAGRAPEAVRDLVRRMAYETYVQEKTYGDPIQLVPPAAARLAELHGPLLAIVGRYDETATSTNADLLVASVPGARRVDVDTAHMPSLERPQWFTETLLAFLAEVEG